MSAKEAGTRDTEYKIAFRKLIAKRNDIPSKLEDLMDIYEVLRPFLPVSNWCKEEIHGMITQAIDKISG